MVGRRELRESGVNCLKYLKSGWNRKEGAANKDLIKGGGEARLRGGCLKKGGWNPLTNNGPFTFFSLGTNGTT